MDTRKAIALLVQASLILVMSIILVVAAVLTYYVEPALFDKDNEIWYVRDVATDLPDGAHGKQVKYGHLLVSETPTWLGPQALEGFQFTGNNLSCSSCHLEAGTKRGAASWIGATKRYPQFRGRENNMVTIADRINGCVERSMNGMALPVDSKQMMAIVAYMEWLDAGIPKDTVGYFTGLGEVSYARIKADPIQGKTIYTIECLVCHGADGAGVWKSDSSAYQYPPLWGQDSYNHGAGMHRVLTAAQFIKANMPWGVATIDNPKLTDAEAIHVAAYINSFERPVKTDVQNDFPELTLKPMSTPYGPWADDFSADQHKYGPFQPIADYYLTTYGITKTK